MGKTVIGVFNDLAVALNTTPDLVRAGILREHISTVAQDKTGKYTQHSRASVDLHTGSDSNTMLGGFGDSLTDTATLAIPGVGLLVVTGPLAAALAGTPIGAVTGGLVGALNGMGVPEREARAYEAELREGQSLIIVRTADVMAVQVMEILRNHHAVHISMRSPGQQTLSCPSSLHRQATH
ncbi:MAG TPA: DUF1269 domain-containing protein [Candidatus Binatia bacterium]|jgi:hypothetical protein|nr:DUF1269 domain-containing protein [Candidatus Binatia bacterium]